MWSWNFIMEGKLKMNVNTVLMQHAKIRADQEFKILKENGINYTNDKFQKTVYDALINVYMKGAWDGGVDRAMANHAMNYCVDRETELKADETMSERYSTEQSIPIYNRIALQLFPYLTINDIHNNTLLYDNGETLKDKHGNVTSRSCHVAYTFLKPLSNNYDFLTDVEIECAKQLKSLTHISINRTDLINTMKIGIIKYLGNSQINYYENKLYFVMTKNMYNTLTRKELIELNLENQQNIALDKSNLLITDDNIFEYDKVYVIQGMSIEHEIPREDSQEWENPADSKQVGRTLVAKMNDEKGLFEVKILNKDMITAYCIEKH